VSASKIPLKALKLFGYTIEGTGDLREVHPADMKVNGRGRWRPVAQEQLDMVQARPRFNQMSRKGMPQCMWAYRFRYTGAFLGFKEYLSYRAYTYMDAFLLSFK
jgi:hypothetical protein